MMKRNGEIGKTKRERKTKRGNLQEEKGDLSRWGEKQENNQRTKFGDASWSRTTLGMLHIC